MYLNSVQLSLSDTIDDRDLVFCGIWITMGKKRKNPSDVGSIQGHGQAGVDGQTADAIAQLDRSRQRVVAGKWAAWNRFGAKGAGAMAETPT